MKQQGLIYYSIIFFSLIISVGCTRTHNMIAREYPIDSTLLPTFASDSPVALINAQNNAEKVLVGTNVGVTFMGNLLQYTDIIIQTMKTELNKKNILVTKEAAKELRFTVTEVEIQPGMWGFGCDAKVTVETGDGWKKDFLGQGGSGTVFVVVNSALNEAVVKILQDDSIISYLKLN